MSKTDFSNLENLDGVEMDSGDWADEKPIHKDVAYLRKKPFVKRLINHSAGYVADLSGNHRVRLDWKLNEVAQRDKVFKLTIDDEKVIYLDLEELTFYTRIMFEK